MKMVALVLILDIMMYHCISLSSTIDADIDDVCNNADADADSDADNAVNDQSCFRFTKSFRLQDQTSL